MANETTFRIVFGLLWVLHFGVRLYFQNKVKGQSKGLGNYVRVNASRESLLFRLFALAYLLLALYIATPWVDFAHVPLPEWLRWAGAALTLLGIGLFSWAHLTLGRNWTAVLALSTSHQLITAGPYRAVRHPMYTSFFVIGIGFLLLSANLLMGGLYLGTLYAMYAGRVAAEERMMLERFGDSYRQYMTRTGRLWPRFGK